MLRCPKCNRTYQDDMQKFCTHDGGRLVPDIERSKPFDPNATVTTSGSNLDIPADPNYSLPTERDLDATLATTPPGSSAYTPSTSEFRTSDTAPTSFPETNRIGQPPSSTPQFPTVSARPPQSSPTNVPRASAITTTAPSNVPAQSTPLASQVAHVPMQPPPVAPAPAKSRLTAALVVVGVLILLVLVGGGVASYFMFFKSKGPRRGREVAAPVIKSVENTNSVNTNVNSGDTKKKAAEAPPNSVKFENSSSGLDAKLAARYVDFHFFYPQSWQKSPKPDAINFVEVERFIPPNFTQEKLVVSWYASKGTVESDLKGFPALIKERSARLAKIYPEYQKLSEGNTTVNGIEGYEFRFKAYSRGTAKGDLYIWGRVVFLPPGDEASTKGVALYMLTTSLAPEVKGPGDVGVRGELPMILNSFTLGKG